MKQRLGIAQALVNAPDLLLLDEPTSALDPMGRKDVLDMIAALKGRTTVFFSTHILSDVERVCDTVAILDKGRVVREAPIGEVKHRGGATRVELVVPDGSERVAAAIERLPWAAEVHREGATITVTLADADAARREIPGVIASVGASLARMEELEPSLEDVFVELVGGEA
jgi:ABC-2 type transport system ATP-binding protein